MLIGYNTNGFAFHRLDDALEIIAELGYECVAITVDHHVLNPLDADAGEQAERTKARLDELGLACVIETGARFLLDPRRKHQPTLLDRRGGGRERRMDFLRRCVDLAAILQARAVSFWSGAQPAGLDDDAAFGVLADACRALADHAAGRGVTLAFEPEPGMFVDTVAKYDRLADAVGRENFGLTVDVGHLYCNEDRAPETILAERAPQLANVHLDDMRRDVHDHLFFGEGEVDFGRVFAALREADYAGPACVELSRHSHNAVEVARRARQFLGRFV